MNHHVNQYGHSGIQRFSFRGVWCCWGYTHTPNYVRGWVPQVNHPSEAGSKVNRTGNETLSDLRQFTGVHGVIQMEKE